MIGQPQPWIKPVTLWAVIPVAWLLLWTVVAALVNLTDIEVVPGEENPAAAKLALLPVLIATCLTALYLQFRFRLPTRSPVPPATLSDHQLANLVATFTCIFFALSMYFCGGPAAFFASSLVLATVEAAHWISAGTTVLPNRGRTSAGRASAGRTNAGRTSVVENEISPQSQNQSQTDIAAASAAANSSGADARNANSSNAHSNSGIKESQFVDEDFDDPEMDDESEDEEESEQESDQAQPHWLQQMTRTYVESADPSTAVDQPQAQQVEWFWRHHWSEDQQQIDIHCLFQPAFEKPPQVQLEVVQGQGRAKIADLQLHGARIELKRDADPDSESTTVIWLTAQG